MNDNNEDSLKRMENHFQSLEIGSNVVLHGLSRHEFNGLFGKIISKEKNGRFGVQVDGHEKPKALKPINLKLNSNSLPFDPPNDVLQNIFKFSDIMECFQTFRLVNKIWKASIENIRLENPSTKKIFEIIYNDETYPWLDIPNASLIPTIYSKILKTCKHFEMIFGVFEIEESEEEFLTHHDLIHEFLFENFHTISPIILNNCRNLVTISLENIGDEIPENYNTFVQQLLLNSQNSLVKICMKKINFQNIIFPKLKTMVIESLSNFSTKIEFENTLQLCLTNMEALKIIELRRLLSHSNYSNEIENYISQNYTDNCVVGNLESAKIFPIKITHFHRFYSLDAEESFAEKFKFPEEIQYLEIIFAFCHMDWNKDIFWKNFKENLLLFPNLKAILLSNNAPPRGFYVTKEYVQENYMQKFTDIWEERFKFLESQKIQILSSQKELNSKIDKLSENLRFGFDFCDSRIY